MKQLISFLIGILLGALGVYFIPGIIKPAKPCPQNGLSKIKIDTVKYAKLFGEEVARDEVINFSDEYRKYLAKKEPDYVQFNKLYTAGSYFTVEEIGNYLNEMIQRSGLEPNQIRMHICTTKYPTGTLKPGSNTLVGDRLSACIVFFRNDGMNPFPEKPIGNGRLRFEDNSFLGAYNWGDLMP
jgi:hypothetical protein